MFWFYVLVILLLSISVFNQETSKNYGPYKLSWFKYETCKGPKKSDCGEVLIEDKKNMSDVIFAVDFPIDCPVTKARITINSIEMNTQKKLWNYAVDSPCKHFVLGPVLNAALNLTEKSCKAIKGSYKTHVNMNDASIKLMGSSFFYGNYTFKIFAHNKVNNFFCLETGYAVMKQKS